MHGRDLRTHPETDLDPGLADDALGLFIRFITSLTPIGSVNYRRSRLPQ